MKRETSVEGLLSTGPTPSSFLIGKISAFSLTFINTESLLEDLVHFKHLHFGHIKAY